MGDASFRDLAGADLTEGASTRVGKNPGGSAAWAFVLEPVDEAHARLITRVGAGYERFAVWLMIGLLLRPIHFGMQRRQLLSVKQRAEAAAR